MPISMATKLGIQFARFAAASGNAGSSGLRGALNNAASGSSSATSSWTQGLSSGGASSANGAGIGGAKFHAGRGAHSSFQQSGRALANANASSSNDGSNSVGDDDEDLAAQQARVHRPGQLHRSALIGRHFSQSHVRLVRSKRETYITSLPALQLILPRAERSLVNSSTSPAHVRTLTNDASTEKTLPDNDIAAPVQEKAIQNSQEPYQQSIQVIQKRRHGRSQSMGPTVGRRSGLLQKDGTADLESMLDGIQTKASVQSGSSNPAEKTQEWPSEEEIILLQALNKDDPKRISAAVRTYRQLDRSKQSVFGFNMALKALLRKLFLTAKDDIRDICTTYIQMIETDKQPNELTWELMTIALCANDLYINSGAIESKRTEHDSFDQAFSLFKLAHGSIKDGGYSSVKPYNKLLSCCTIRGDVQRACEVLQQLSLNKHVDPTTETFGHLLQCFAKDTTFIANETEEEKNKRILKSTLQIFESFEKKRIYGNFDNENSLNPAAQIWNSMISIYCDCDDVANAFVLIERMLTDTSAPIPTSSTSEIIITALYRRGESAEAMKWLERIISSQLEAKENNLSEQKPQDARLMPIPMLKLSDLPTRESADVDDMPRAQLLTRSALGLLEVYQEKPLDEERRLNLIKLTGRALYARNNAIVKCRSTDENLASTLLQDSLQMILKHSQVNNVTAKDMMFSTDIVHSSRKLAKTIFFIVWQLFGLRRFQDAASAFTYAVHYFLLDPEVRGRFAEMEESVQVGKVLLYVKDMTMLLLGKGLPWSDIFIQENPMNESELEKNAVQMLIAAVQIIVPAVEPLDSPTISISFRERIVEIYSVARKQIAIEKLPFSPKEWSSLVEIFVSQERRDETKFERESGCLVLLQDLSKLSSEMVKEMDLSGLGSIVLRKYPSEGVALLRAINPSLVEQISAASSESASPSDDISDATAKSDLTTTTMSFESILDGFTSPPSSVGKSFTQQAYPPIQVIDEDFCSELAEQNSGTRRTRYAPAQPPDTDGAFEKLMLSISESGRYPTTRSIGAMMVSAGRSGNLDRIQQLYVIGCHIVASLGGDLDWQHWSWATLENEMITGLAHAGEAKAASDHRHRLINAGHVPTANAYAALVSVVRDTTDDAMIAEELYQESQRLGVEPNVFLYNTVISKLCRARKLERAMQLFDEMRQRGLNPSSVTYGALINGCTRIGDEAKAEELYNLMESDRKFKPQAPPFNTMIQFYVHSLPNRSKALDYYKRMLRHNVSPTAHTFKLLLDAHGTIEPIDIVGMQGIFGRLIADRRINVEGTHWASIITAHGIHCKNLSKASEIFDSIPNHVSTRKSKSKLPDALTYEALLNVFLTHGRLDLMQKYFAKLRQDGIQPTAYLANLMIRGLATTEGEEQKGLQQARDLFGEMHDPPMGVAAFGNHPPNHRHHANGSHTIAHEPNSFNGGLYGFQNVLREPSTFEAMIKVELQYGQKENAVNLLERMKERGYPPALITKASSFITAEEQNLNHQAAAQL